MMKNVVLLFLENVAQHFLKNVENYRFSIFTKIVDSGNISQHFLKNIDSIGEKMLIQYF
jgi:hypothetical protein